MDKQIKELKKCIDESKYTVAVTGAGISVSSGGMTFSHASRKDLNEMQVIGSEDELKNNPEHYYSALYKSFLQSMFEGGPDKAHKALARLEKEGKLAGIITTNVDCLHTIAGSKNVAEIQGSLQVNECCECRRHYDDYHIWSHGKVPECTECGGKIWAFPFYSHVGLYDKGVEMAQEMISKAELILVIGTNGPYSGVYWPYRNSNALVIQINPGRTPFDRVAALNIRRGADEVFDELFQEDNR